MIYSREFFDLQIAFAERAARVAGIAFERALLDYTNLFRRLGCGREFDPVQPKWRELLTGIAAADDAGQFTYRFYLRDAEASTASPRVGSFGCFSYEIRSGSVVRIHFDGSGGGERSVLDRALVSERRAELSALAEHIRSSGATDMEVMGSSWLYNLEAYRRLFPPAFIASMTVVPGRFRYMSRWGQFVDRHGTVREEVARAFLGAVDAATTVDDLERSVPLPTFRTRMPFDEFSAFYGVT